MRIFMKLAVVCILAMMSNNGLCNVSPFGLELNKATINDLKSKYDIFDIVKTQNQETHILVSPQLMDLKGLKESVFIFDNQGVLQSVMLTMDKSQFDEMYKILLQKYNLDEKLLPLVGNKYASFSYKESMIKIIAPHLDFDLKIIYVTKSHFKKYLETKEKLEKIEQEKKKALL